METYKVSIEMQGHHKMTNGYIVWYKRGESRNWETQYCVGAQIVIAKLWQGTYNVRIQSCNKDATISAPVDATLDVSASALHYVVHDETPSKHHQT